MRQSFLLLLFLAYAVAEFSLKRVSDCLNRKLSNKKFKKVKESPIYLNYGIIGLEALNAISPHQLKQIEYLSQCVQEEDVSFFALSADNEEVYHSYGGSNVTTLTGIIQNLLPELQRELMQATLRLLKKADWTEKRNNFGIKKAVYLSFEKEGIQEHLAVVQEERKAREKAGEAFVLYPHEHMAAMTNEKNREREARAKKHLSFIHDHQCAYTLIVLLDERRQFVGGEIIAQHQPNEDNLLTEDYDDEEEDPNSSVIVPQHQYDPPPRKGRPTYYELEPIALEKNSMLMMNSRLKHGTEELTRGRRRALVIDLWHYRDAPITTKTLSIEEGKALGELPESVFTFDL